MKRGYEFAQKNNVAPLKKMVGKFAPKAPRTAQQITPMHLILVAVLCIVIGVAGAVTMVSPETVRRIQHKQLLF
jgi:heme/copper-type cytochrome/quinol oxidase subunit 2